MRVLQILNDLRVGGAESLCRQLAVQLNARSDVTCEVHTLAETDSPLAAGLRQDGVRLTSSGAIGLRSPRQIGLLRERLRGFDVVHVHLFPAQLWAAIAAGQLPKRQRPRLVTTEHNTYNRRRESPLWRALDGWMYRRYDAIIAISQATAEALTAWAPAVRERVCVVWNGIDYDRFANALESVDRPLLVLIDIPADATILLCVGRLEAQKDQATLLRALPLLPGNMHVALAGTGALQDELERLAADLGVRQRVHFLGRREDIPELLRASTVYVQPSRWEGFGLAVAEAMAAGVPVIVSDVPGVREVVGDAGILIPAGDAAALAAGVQRILADTDLRERLMAAGRERARAFRFERFADEVCAVYARSQAGQ